MEQADSCAGPGRGPAKQMKVGRERAHCASNVCASPGFSSRKATFGKKSSARPDYRSRAAHIANPDFPMEFAGLPWDFERHRASTVPKPVPALHHLVTAVSIKKALMGPIQLPSAEDPASSRPQAGRAHRSSESDIDIYLPDRWAIRPARSAAHRGKMRSGDRLSIARTARCGNNWGRFVPLKNVPFYCPV